MPTNYGSLTILDTLAAINVSVLEFGEENMAGYVQQILDAWESILTDIVSPLVADVPQRETTYGTNSTTGDMVDIDEFGMADAQKTPYSQAAVGFPLRNTGYSLQWTRNFLAQIRPVEMAKQVLDMTEADRRKVYSRLRTALFKATNNTGYRDRITDNKNYTIKALVNADSDPMPPQPISNVTFNAATHTHYLATAAFIEANFVALIETVREHGVFDGQLRVYINAAQEAAVRAFADFRGYIDTRLVYASTTTRAAQGGEFVNLEDRAIGFYGPAEVWVKPWMPASYLLCFRDGGGGEPVLGWRRPEGGLANLGNLSLVADIDRHPLHARGWEHMYGLAVWNRVRAAVLYTGGGSYVSFVG